VFCPIENNINTTNSEMLCLNYFDRDATNPVPILDPGSTPEGRSQTRAHLPPPRLPTRRNFPYGAGQVFGSARWMVLSVGRNGSLLGQLPDVEALAAVAISSLAREHFESRGQIAGVTPCAPLLLGICSH
jgi:hypothetical protein